jgi:hypothetical protein
MVRFEAGSGVMSTASSKPVLVFAPSVVDPLALNTLPAAFRTLRRENPRRYVERVLNDTYTGLSSQQRAAKIQALLGDESVDTVLARAAGQIALCDEVKLATALGVRLDSITGSLYQPWRTGNTDLTFLPGVNSTRINEWIEGDTNLDGMIDPTRTARGDAPEARMFTIDRYTAVLRDVEVQR